MVDDPDIKDHKQAVRIVFLVGGVAAGTLLINASTFKLVMTKLRMTAAPEARHRQLKQLHDALEKRTMQRYLKLTASTGADPDPTGEEDLEDSEAGVYFALADDVILAELVSALRRKEENLRSTLMCFVFADTKSILQATVSAWRQH